MTQAQLHSVTPGDIPPDAEVFSIRAPDGVELRAARWKAPASGPARGTVVLFHGFTEYIEKYYEVIRHLRDRGFGVVTFDWRGQGLSTRLLPNRCKGHVDDYSHFMSDALLVYEELARDMPGPHLLLGHSMGGHLALRFLQDFPGRFERAVLSAPMMGWDQFPLVAMRAVAEANVALGQGTSYAWGRGDPDMENPVNNVTTDAQRFERAAKFWREVPDLRVGGPTWRWLQQATASIARTMDRERLIQVKAPVLVASAENDAVISSRKHQELPFLNTTFTILPVVGAMHEILQETDEIQSRFWRGFDQFLG